MNIDEVECCEEKDTHEELVKAVHDRLPSEDKL